MEDVTPTRTGYVLKREGHRALGYRAPTLGEKQKAYLHRAYPHIVFEDRRRELEYIRGKK